VIRREEEKGNGREKWGGEREREGERERGAGEEEEEEETRDYEDYGKAT